MSFNYIWKKTIYKSCVLRTKTVSYSWYGQQCWICIKVTRLDDSSDVRSPIPSAIQATVSRQNSGSYYACYVCGKCFWDDVAWLGPGSNVFLNIADIHYFSVTVCIFVHYPSLAFTNLWYIIQTKWEVKHFTYYANFQKQFSISWIVTYIISIEHICDTFTEKYGNP